MDRSVDLAVIGGGPGGYAAALKAVGLGMSAAVVEKEKLGGVCLNWGCIPTKSLLYSARLLHEMKTAGLFGISVENARPVFEGVLRRSRFCADRLGGGIEFLMKNKNVAVIYGTGSLTGPQTVEVRDRDGNVTETISAKHILIAVGGRPKLLPGVVPDGRIIWTARHALAPEKQPETLTIIGGGAIGAEMASFYQAMGTQVTVIEGMNRVLPAEDRDVSEAVRKSFTRRGIEIVTEASVKSVAAEEEHAAVHFTADGEEQVRISSAVLMALGVSPNTANLGLEKVGIAVNAAGGIVTDEWGMTSEPSVFAVGDATVPPFLAHKAVRQGITAVERIAGKKDIRPWASLPMPACTFCMPQAASIGLTEEKARAEFGDIAVGRFPFLGNGKSVVIGETEGFVKTVINRKDGRILGVHMVGEGVTELVGAMSMAMTAGLTWEKAAETIFPHPTQSEMLEEALFAAFGEAIHV